MPADNKTILHGDNKDGRREPERDKARKRNKKPNMGRIG
jgi:hypothetical protein